MSDLELLSREIGDSILGLNRALDQRLVDAMCAKDIDAVLSCFSKDPDLVVVLYGEVLRGPEALMQFASRLFSAHRRVSLEINEVTHWTLGDTVFAVGTATYDLEALDGSQSQLRERWTDARQKFGNEWRYVLDHAELIPA